MSKEIKFRAWLKENYLERYGWDKRAEELGRMRKVHSIHLNKKKVIISSKYGGNISVPFQYIELMQYTGLKDKNGVEIYEGDIVKDERERKFIIEFKFGGFNVVPIDCYNDEFSWNPLGDMQCAGFIEESCEVIGNIYENPELLEVQNGDSNSTR